MKTIEYTPYQTVESMIRKHEELALFYIEKAGAAALEAGKTIGVQSTNHRVAANVFYGQATEQTKLAEGLKGFLAAKRTESAAPAIERAK
jgi:hypothetical protein